MSDITITICGKGPRHTVEARDASGRMFHTDKLDVGSAISRKRFAGATAKAIGQNGEVVNTIEADLVSKLDDLRKASTAQSEDNSVLVVRPELIFTREVIGLTVAEPAIIDGKPAARWMTCLRRRSGDREVVPLPSSIDLPDGSKLWLSPDPGTPPTALLRTWRRPARQQWLDGCNACDAATVFKALCERIGHYIDFPDADAPGAVATVALWTLLSYVYPAFNAVPYLYLGGPLGSGKSRVLEVLSQVVYRPLASSNMTAPALFRTLDKRGGALLMDEVERLREGTPEAAELRSILLAGYKGNARATRLEAVGESFQTVEFCVYGPKALACIAGLPPALLSRCIPLMMFRSAPGSPKPSRRVDADPAWQTIRDDLHALTLGPLGMAAMDLAADVEVCTFPGRQFELWQPLLAIARFIERAGAAGLVEVVRAHALEVIEANRDDAVPDQDETLLRVLADCVEALETPTPSEILGKAQAIDPAGFRNWSASGVGNHLRRYGLRARRGRQRRYHATTDELRRIERVYGMLFIDTPPVQASQPSQVTTGDGAKPHETP